MVKLTKETPGGNIEVKVTEHGLQLAVGGFHLADIYYNEEVKCFEGTFLNDENGKKEIQTFRKNGWFAAGKPEYIQRVCEDIELVMDEKEMDITDEQMIAVADEVVDNYGNEDYNEYIAELLEDIKQVGEA